MAHIAPDAVYDRLNLSIGGQWRYANMALDVVPPLPRQIQERKLKQVVNRKLLRIQRGYQRYGAVGVVLRMVKSGCNHLFRNKTFVFERGPIVGEFSSRWDVVRIDSLEGLPEEYHKALVVEEGELIDGLLAREFSRNGTLWLSLVEGAVAGYAWTRHPDVGQEWFVEVTPDDTIVLATVTFVGYRGKGVMTDLVQTALQREVPPGGRALVDCRKWNTPAIKFIERSGFERIR